MHEGRELINYASYDYLGLNQEPAVAEAAKAAIDELGTSVSASRLVAGERRCTASSRRTLADFYGADDCLAFVSGHATNMSTIGVLMGPEDLIVQDELMHNSAIVGAKLSRATTISFPPQQSQRPGEDAAGEPRQAQERADPHRGPLLDGRRLSRICRA